MNRIVILMFLALTFFYDVSHGCVGKGNVGENVRLNPDIFVVIMNKRGDVDWQKTLGAEGQDVCLAIKTAAGDSFITTWLTNSKHGEFTFGLGWYGLAYVMKLDPTGRLTATTTVGNQYSPSSSIGVSPNPASTSCTVTYDVETL